MLLLLFLLLNEEEKEVAKVHLSKKNHKHQIRPHVWWSYISLFRSLLYRLWCIYLSFVCCRLTLTVCQTCNVFLWASTTSPGRRLVDLLTLFIHLCFLNLLYCFSDAFTSYQHLYKLRDPRIRCSKNCFVCAEKLADSYNRCISHGARDHRQQRDYDT